MVKVIGTGFSVLLTLAGLGLGIWGLVMPHVGLAIAGFGIAIISGYGIYLTK